MKTDCFAYRGGKSCNALKELDCDDCPFYKTKEQVEQEEKLVQKRLLQVGKITEGVKLPRGRNKEFKCTLINSKTGEVLEFKSMNQASKFLKRPENFIYMKKKARGNEFEIDGYTVKVSDKSE